MQFLLYLGHVNLDITLYVEEFGDVGESRAVENFEKRIGGTAYNAYMSLKTLEVPVQIFSVVGPEIGGIDGIFVRDAKTPTCWIVTDRKEQMAYIYQGLWDKLENMDIKIPVENYRWLHFSTGNPKFYLKIAKEAKKAGKLIGFDPSQEIHYIYDKDIFKELLSLADIFFCNEREFERARELSGEKLYQKRIIRTEGPRGASFYDPQSGWTHIPGNPQTPVDTVGAGDTFRAGFYAALYRGYDMVSAIKMGNLVASCVVSSKKSYYTGSWEDLKFMRKKI